jgi:hypothetical protein
MMVRTRFVGGLLGLLALSFAIPAAAHHSFAVYDHTRSVTLRGTVTKFQWTNPHGFIELDVTQPDGSIKHWSVETTSINMMQRLGWRSTMIKAGDKLKVVAAPLLNGDPAALLLEVTFPDGKKMEPGVPAASTFVRTPDPAEHK